GGRCGPRRHRYRGRDSGIGRADFQPLIGRERTMSIQRNDWSLQRKGIIDQDRHKERVREAIKKNLGSIVSNEAIILSDGKRTVKVPMRALDEYKFRFDYRKRKHVG